MKDDTEFRQKIYPRAEFVTFLIDRLLHQTELNAVKSGDFVVYFKDGTPTHAGKWHDGQVRSKWGERSHLWQHRVYEVPLEYGSDVRFFLKLPGPEIEDVFCQWAQSRPRT